MLARVNSSRDGRDGGDIRSVRTNGAKAAVEPAADENWPLRNVDFVFFRQRRRCDSERDGHDGGAGRRFGCAHGSGVLPDDGAARAACTEHDEHGDDEHEKPSTNRPSSDDAPSASGLAHRHRIASRPSRLDPPARAARGAICVLFVFYHFFHSLTCFSCFLLKTETSARKQRRYRTLSHTRHTRIRLTSGPTQNDCFIIFFFLIYSKFY